MIVVVVAAIVTGCATAVVPTVLRHIETVVTNKRLQRAHRTATERTKP